MRSGSAGASDARIFEDVNPKNATTTGTIHSMSSVSASVSNPQSLRGAVHGKGPYRPSSSSKTSDAAGLMSFSGYPSSYSSSHGHCRYGFRSKISERPSSRNSNTSSNSSLLLSEQHGILTDIAHRLSTYKKVQPTCTSTASSSEKHAAITGSGADTGASSNNSSCTTVRKEAELLLNFMSTTPNAETNPGVSTHNRPSEKEPLMSMSMVGPGNGGARETAIAVAVRKVSNESRDNTDTAYTYTCTTTSKTATGDNSTTQSGNLTTIDITPTFTTSTTRPSITQTTQLKTPQGSFSSVISPSFSFESRRQPCTGAVKPWGEPKSLKRPSDDNDSTKSRRRTDKMFDLICPSLSLEQNLPHSVSLSTHTHTQQSQIPSDLFARPIKACLENHSGIGMPSNVHIAGGFHKTELKLEDISSMLASNIIESFLTAIQWRTKAWMKSLTSVLTRRYQQQLLEKYSSSSTTSSKDADNGNTKSKSSRQKFKHKLRQSLKQSHEARVISALLRAKDAMVVHDVRTTFSVMEEQSQQDHGDANMMMDHQSDREEKKEDIHSMAMATVPFFKKRKLNHGNTDDRLVEYEITHALMLETTCSVSTSTMEQMTISFTTPGTICGTFTQHHTSTKSSYPPSSQLSSLTLHLDTHILADALETHSRRVVRASAQEFMIGVPKHICTIHDTVQVQTEAKKHQQRRERHMSMSSSSSSSEDEKMSAAVSLALTPTLIGYASGSDYDYDRCGTGNGNGASKYSCPSLSSSDSCHSYVFDTPEYTSEAEDGEGAASAKGSGSCSSEEENDYSSYFVREDKLSAAPKTEQKRKKTRGANAATKNVSVNTSHGGAGGGCPLVTPIATETTHVTLDILGSVQEPQQMEMEAGRGETNKKSPRLPLDKIGEGGIGIGGMNNIGIHTRSSLKEQRDLHRHLQLTFLNPRRVSPSADAQGQKQTTNHDIHQTQVKTQEQDESFASPVPTPSKIMDASDSANATTSATIALQTHLAPPSLVSPGGAISGGRYNLRKLGLLGEEEGPISVSAASVPPMPVLLEQSTASSPTRTRAADAAAVMQERCQ